MDFRTLALVGAVVAILGAATLAVHYLRRFTEEALSRYLRHLQYLAQPLHTPWVDRQVAGHLEHTPAEPSL